MKHTIRSEGTVDYLLSNGFLESLDDYLRRQNPENYEHSLVRGIEEPVRTNLGFTKLNLEKLEER